MGPTKDLDPGRDSKRSTSHAFIDCTEHEHLYSVVFLAQLEDVRLFASFSEFYQQSITTIDRFQSDLME